MPQARTMLLAPYGGLTGWWKNLRRVTPLDALCRGRYLLSPRIMYILARQGPGVGGEIQLTDALVRLLDEEVYALALAPIEGCDTGTPAAWAGTNARMVLVADGDVAREFGEALGEIPFG